MIALSVAKLEMSSPRSEIFPWIKPKKKKTTFLWSLDQCRRLKVREKARNVFCDEPTSVRPQGVTQHRLFIKDFFNFARIFWLFSLLFRTSNFWSLRNLIKQLFHSRLLDMRLVIVNLAHCASLAIYHRISTACSWNNSTRKPLECLLTKGSEVEFRETQLEAGFDHRAPIPLKSFSEFPNTGQAHSYSSFPHSSKTNIILNWCDMIWFNLICTKLHFISYHSVEGPYQPLPVLEGKCS